MLTDRQLKALMNWSRAAAIQVMGEKFYIAPDGGSVAVALYEDRARAELYDAFGFVSDEKGDPVPAPQKGGQ
jgi:hypothetical protein